jgi:hypothetical protein
MAATVPPAIARAPSTTRARFVCSLKRKSRMGGQMKGGETKGRESEGGF